MYGTMYSMYEENFKFRAYTTEFVAVKKEHYECSKLCKTWTNIKPFAKTAQNFLSKMHNNGNIQTRMQKTMQNFISTGMPTSYYSRNKSQINT